jgi:transcriptional regulator with XRE-family HTH domain
MSVTARRPTENRLDARLPPEIGALVVAMIAELDQLRRDRSLTKGELAERMGTAPSAVRRCLTANARHNPSLGWVLRAANALDCDLVLLPKPAVAGVEHLTDQAVHAAEPPVSLQRAVSADEILERWRGQ